jgi:hypothetical protein
MAAIQFDRGAWDTTEPWIPTAPTPARRAPLQLVAAPPSRRRPDAHVLRRRRLLVAVLAVVLLLASVGGVTRFASASAAAGAAPATPVVLVAQAGDSYWTLARAVHAGGDLRSTVDALVAANGGGDLHPGDRITLTR